MSDWNGWEVLETRNFQEMAGKQKTKEQETEKKEVPFHALPGKKLAEKKEKKEAVPVQELVTEEVKKTGSIRILSAETLRTADKKQEKLKTGEKQTKKKQEAIVPDIAFDEKFVKVQEEDSDRMKAVREQMGLYFHYKDTKFERIYLTRLVKACKKYRYMRFSAFKWGRGAKRLAEVREIEKKASELLYKEDSKGLKLLSNEYLEDSDIRFNGEYPSTGEGVLTALLTFFRFTIENPLRLGIAALGMPFYLLNEGIRKIRIAQGKQPQRHLKLPGLHGPRTYYIETFRKLKGYHNNAGGGGGGKFLDYFFENYKHDKEILARERAEQDELYADEERARGMEEGSLFDRTQEVGHMKADNISGSDDEEEFETEEKTEEKTKEKTEEKTGEKTEEKRKGKTEEKIGEKTGKEPGYVRRITDSYDIERINSNDEAMSSRIQIAAYIVEKLKLMEKAGHMTWDQAKDEIKSWMKGRSFVERNVKRVKNANGSEEEQLVNELITITDENMEEQLSYIREELEKHGNLVVKKQYSEEEQALYGKEYKDIPKFEKGSLKALLKEALETGNINTLTKFPEKKAGSKLEQDFRLFFFRGIRDGLINFSFNKKKIYESRKDWRIPKEDEAQLKWLLNNLPEDISSYEQVLELERKWNAKMEYDLAAGKYAEHFGRRKMEIALKALKEAAKEKDVESIEARNERLLTLLNQMDLNTEVRKIQDQKISNDIEKEIPNEKQNYLNSCWATSGTLITNWYIQHELKADIPRVSQETFCDPANVVLNPYAQRTVNKERNQDSKEGFIAELNNIEMYMKTTGGSTGNLFQAADVMMKRLPKTAVRTLRFSIPNNDAFIGKAMESQQTRKKLSALFFQKLAQAMEQGSGPISLLIPGHYLTIVGIKAGELICRDSLKENGAKARILSLKEFVEEMDKASQRTGRFEAEAVYLQKLEGDKKAELEKEYGYSYDQEGKLNYSVADEIVDAGATENMLRNYGKVFEKKSEEPKDMLDIYLREQIYVPKHLDNKVNTEQVDAWREKELEKLEEEQKLIERKAALEREGKVKAQEKAGRQTKKTKRSQQEEQELKKKEAEALKQKQKEEEEKKAKEKEEQERKAKEKEEEERKAKEKEEQERKVKEKEEAEKKAKEKEEEEKKAKEKEEQEKKEQEKKEQEKKAKEMEEKKKKEEETLKAKIRAGLEERIEQRERELEEKREKEKETEEEDDFWQESDEGDIMKELEELEKDLSSQ